MSYTKFIENNIDELIQIYMKEVNYSSNTNTQRGVLFVDFRQQQKMKVDVRYLELTYLPEDIRKIVQEKATNPLYDSVIFLCVLRPDDRCLLFDINLDEARNKHFDHLRLEEITRDTVNTTTIDPTLENNKRQKQTETTRTKQKHKDKKNSQLLNTIGE